MSILRSQESNNNALETVKEGANQVGRSIQSGSLAARDYAIEHKAITIAGAVALGALGFGIYALLRTRDR